MDRSRADAFEDEDDDNDSTMCFVLATPLWNVIIDVLSLKKISFYVARSLYKQK
jgi:hypothetical protein